MAQKAFSSKNFSASSAVISCNQTTSDMVSVSREGGGSGFGHVSGGFGSRNFHGFGTSKRMSMGSFCTGRSAYGYGLGHGAVGYRFGGGVYSHVGCGAVGAMGIHKVTVNPSLLAHLNLEIDQTIQRIRKKEKTLNNKFASFIDKYEELRFSVRTHGSDLCNTKIEISELNRIIQRLHSEFGAVKKQCATVQVTIEDMKQCGEFALKDASQKLAELEEVLTKAKAEMARQLREHQDLLNIKLAGDDVGTINISVVHSSRGRIYDGRRAVGLADGAPFCCRGGLSPGGSIFTSSPGQGLKGGSGLAKAGSSSMKIVTNTSMARKSYRS